MDVPSYKAGVVQHLFVTELKEVCCISTDSFTSLSLLPNVCVARATIMDRHRRQGRTSLYTAQPGITFYSKVSSLVETPDAGPSYGQMPSKGEERFLQGWETVSRSMKILQGTPENSCRESDIVSAAWMQRRAVYTTQSLDIGALLKPHRSFEETWCSDTKARPIN